MERHHPFWEIKTQVSKTPEHRLSLHATLMPQTLFSLPFVSDSFFPAKLQSCSSFCVIPLRCWKHCVKHRESWRWKKSLHHDIPSEWKDCTPSSSSCFWCISLWDGNRVSVSVLDSETPFRKRCLFYMRRHLSHRLSFKIKEHHHPRHDCHYSKVRR